MLTKIETLYEPLLRERQAAELLGVTPRCLQAWRFYGHGCPYVKLGSSVRYKLSDLRAFVDANTCGGDAGQAATTGATDRAAASR